MGLTYHFRFSAPAETPREHLVAFLRSVENEAQRMGFAPTIVVDAPFDTPERKQFARRVAVGLTIEDPRLQDATLHESVDVWAGSPGHDTRVIGPAHGVFLVVTDERGRECVFGFCRYPAVLRDRNGRELMRPPQAQAWTFTEFLKTPDPRYREIVARFAEAGYLALERDDYAASSART